MAAWFSQTGIPTGGKSTFWLGIRISQEHRAVDGAGFVLF